MSLRGCKSPPFEAMPWFSQFAKPQSKKLPIIWDVK
jgi:hypothetical protein